MSLLVWLPCDKTNNNQGLQNTEVLWTSSNNSIVDGGKIGKCLKTTTNGNIDSKCSIDFNTTDISFGAWYKFNKAEIQTAIGNLNYTSSAKAATGNLIGNDSYGGIGIIWVSNDMYSSSKVLSTISIFAHIRTATASKTTSVFVVDFDTWTHIMLTYNATNRVLSLYKNGILFDSQTLSAFSDGKVGNLFINYGAVYGGNGPGACIPYYSNDLRIYNHCLSPKEVKDISQGLVVHYQLKDSRIESTTNLVTSLTAGGQTTLSSDKLSVTSSGANSDTYFTINLSEDISVGTQYTISCDVSGMNDGKTWNFPLGAQTNTTLSWLLHNGHNVKTFTANDITWGTKRIFMDDNGREGGIGAIVTFSHFQLEKKDHETAYVIGSRTASTKIYDSSGYANHGETWAYDTAGSIEMNSSTPRFSESTFINSNNNTNTASGTRYIYGYCKLTTPNQLTVAFWCNAIAGYGGATNQGQFSLTNNDIGSSAGQDYNTAPMNHRDGTVDINSVATVTTIRPTITFTANEWHHYAITYDGRYGKVYKDGVLSDTKDMGSNKTLGDMKGIVIGFSKAGAVWRKNKSYYSDFRLYVTALSADDIKDIYQSAGHVDNNGNFYAYEYVEG